MNINADLQKRSNNICELCGSTTANIDYAVPAGPAGNELDQHLLICSTCYGEIKHAETADPIHWQCLKESIHSEVPAARVISWRMLQKLKQYEWAQKLLDANPLDERTLSWAKAADNDINSGIDAISTAN